MWFGNCNICSLIFTSLELEIGLNKHVQNVAEIKNRLWFFLLLIKCWTSIVSLTCPKRILGEFPLWNCLHAKELLAQSKHYVLNLSCCKGIRVYKRLVPKQTLYYLDKLAKYLNCFVRIYPYDAFGCVFCIMSHTCIE